MSEQQLIREILCRSKSSNWNIAKLEWSLFDITIVETPETCLCGHFPIIELCTLINKENNNYVIVGNCCVKQFMGLQSDIIFQGIKRIKNNTTKSPNTELLNYVYKKGWLNEWEIMFSKNTNKKRKLSEKQLNARIKINEKILYRFNKNKTIIAIQQNSAGN